MLIVQKKDAKPQTMWTPMTKKVLSAAENTIGLKDKQQQKLHQMKLGHYPNSRRNRDNNNKQKRTELNQQKNEVLKKNKYTVKAETNK